MIQDERRRHHTRLGSACWAERAFFERPLPIEWYDHDRRRTSPDWGGQEAPARARVQGAAEGETVIDGRRGRGTMQGRGLADFRIPQVLIR